jgi:uncharacterized protein YlzI (FlbEa/FlbD family)
MIFIDAMSNNGQPILINLDDIGTVSENNSSTTAIYLSYSDQKIVVMMPYDDFVQTIRQYCQVIPMGGKKHVTQ